MEGLPDLLRKILVARGISQDSDIQRFLFPNVSDLPLPHDCMQDIREAISRLLKAREEKEKVLVFGDYDVDGTTSAALLTRVLRLWGFQVETFIPHRIDHGYGVTKKAACVLRQKWPDVKLVVTCDCGIASEDGIAFLKSEGVSVIVTDHHEVPAKRVPADAVLNPKQKNCPYPEKRLAGVGVAFLLLLALRKALNARDFILTPYLDLVAVGTIADMSELLGANRILVRAGLERLRQPQNLGLRVLIESLGLSDRAIKSKDVGFLIGPRLNASGRVGDPECGLRLLMSDDLQESRRIVEELEKKNNLRRSLQEESVERASQLAEIQLRENPHRGGFVLFDPTFHLGIVGLVASKICERTKRPVCVLTELNDEHELAHFSTTERLVKGSLRAPLGYHLAQMIDAIRLRHPDLIKSGGGHAQAAGVSLSLHDWPLFQREFEEEAARRESLSPCVEADGVFAGDAGVLQYWPLLEPFGQGNPAPVLRVDQYEVERVRIMKDVHLRLQGRVGRMTMPVLHFKSPWVKIFRSMGTEARISFVGELTENIWNGEKSWEFLLKELIHFQRGNNFFKGEALREYSDDQAAVQI